MVLSWVVLLSSCVFDCTVFDVRAFVVNCVTDGGVSSMPYIFAVTYATSYRNNKVKIRTYTCFVSFIERTKSYIRCNSQNRLNKQWKTMLELFFYKISLWNNLMHITQQTVVGSQVRASFIHPKQVLILRKRCATLQKHISTLHRHQSHFSAKCRYIL